MKSAYNIVTVPVKSRHCYYTHREKIPGIFSSRVSTTVVSEAGVRTTSPLFPFTAKEQKKQSVPGLDDPMG